jgi:hypothetical protein
MLANKSASGEARAILRHMAQVWLRLADKERSTAPQRLQIEPKVKPMRMTTGTNFCCGA